MSSKSARAFGASSPRRTQITTWGLIGGVNGQRALFADRPAAQLLVRIRTGVVRRDFERPVESLCGLAQEFLHLGVTDNLAERGFFVGGLERLAAGIMDDRHGSRG